MSTHDRHTRKITRAAQWRVFLRSIASVWPIIGVLFLLTTSSALAYSAYPQADALPPQNLARIGVSVVRLISFYKSSTSLSAQNTIACTGLGVIVTGGTATDANDQNNWVLTSGSLVNPTQADCTTGTPKALLTAITVMLSSAYNPHVVTFSASLANVAAGSTSESLPTPVVICQHSQACGSGLALFPFHSAQTLPYADLATAPTLQADTIALTQNSTAQTLPPVSITGTTTSFQKSVSSYLTPVIATVNAAEAGTPLVDATGDLTGLHLTALASTTVTDIQTFLNTQDALATFFKEHHNLVHDNWRNGITLLYQNPSNPQEANADFKRVLQENSQFEGAQHFAQLTGSATTASNSGPDKKNTPVSTGIPFPPSNITIGNLMLPTIPLLISALIVLIALIFLMTRLFSYPARRRFEREMAEARAIAKDQLTKMQQDQQGAAWKQQSAPQFSIPMPVAAPQEPPTLPMMPIQSASTPQELLCPNCQTLVMTGTTYCPNCGTLLSPSESGLHLRPIQPVQQLSPSMPPLMPKSPAIENQTTLEFPFDSSALQHSPTGGSNGISSYQAYPAAAERTLPDLARSQEEATTLPISPSHKWPAATPTSNFAGFEVAPCTNRGIKRQHKANEDSVFAAQGTCQINGTPQQVGLFVVADGMGGHANGQDASRLAIQTIKAHIVPQLQNGMQMDKEALRQLLVEGVRQANQAIHERNMEQHADMGTTMTAALIVSMPTTETNANGQMTTSPYTACVINVGDSRTYLYRLSEGLKKLTQDHSVVASLVAAGIIQEDDIYTHPRRNQIYRSLGEKLDVEVDAFIEAFRAGDWLLLCSDGLWDMVRDPKIEEVIRTHLDSAASMGQALIQAALEGGGEDNVSIIVVHLPDGILTRSPHPLQEMEVVGRDKE